jgi:prepilin-type N-terminal cleavage/methylation domain-containing protein
MRRSGFTLVEMLLALGLSSLVLTSTLFIVFSYTQIWEVSQKDGLFAQHVDGVSFFLQNLIDNAAESSDESETVQSTEANATAPIPLKLSKPDVLSSIHSPVISFNLDKANSILSNQKTAPLNLNVFIVFYPDRGLYLVWHSTIETINTAKDLLNVPISTYINGWEYGYYDSKTDSWEFTVEPKSKSLDEYEWPQLVRVTFMRHEETIQRNLYLPQPSLNGFSL